MTAAGRVATVLRVAELQARVARAAASADVAGERRAHAEELAWRTHLAATPGDGPLPVRAARAGLRARAVLDAEQRTAEAAARAAVSVAGYVAAAGRASLLADLVARKRDEAEQAAVAAEQRLADDLAGLRSREATA